MEDVPNHSARVRLKMMSGKKRMHLPVQSSALNQASNGGSYYIRSNSRHFIFIISLHVAMVGSSPLMHSIGISVYE